MQSAYCDYGNFDVLNHYILCNAVVILVITVQSLVVLRCAPHCCTITQHCTHSHHLRWFLVYTAFPVLKDFVQYASSSLPCVLVVFTVLPPSHMFCTVHIFSISRWFCCVHYPPLCPPQWCPPGARLNIAHDLA